MKDEAANKYDLIYSHNHRHIGIDDRNTMVIYRHPIYALISWWEYWEEEKAYFPNSLEKRNKFNNFLITRFEYWKSFFIEAMSNKNKDNVYLIRYDELINSSEESFVRMINILDDKEEIDIGKVKKIINKEQHKGDVRKSSKQGEVPVFHQLRSLKACPFYQLEPEKFNYIYKETEILLDQYGSKIEPM